MPGVTTMQSTTNTIEAKERRYLVKTPKWLLTGLLLLTLTACGSNSNIGAVTAQETAIEKIADYAQNGGVSPTLQDYLDAGITGVDANNLAEINTAVEQLIHDDVDTEAEIQTVADSLGVGLLDAPALDTLLARLYTVGGTIATLSFINTGGGELTSCSADSLPAGLSVAKSADSKTCEITGAPTAVQVALTHTITATNATGSDMATVSIMVKAPTPPLALPALQNATVQVYKKNMAIAPLVFTNTGGGKLTNCSADSLPIGLSVTKSADSKTCKITGTPTAVQAATTHTITVTNATGSDMATVSIMVKALVPPLALPALQNVTAQVYTKDVAIVPLVFTNTGGGKLTNCSADSLPIGLSVAKSADSKTCEITGTPTAIQAATTHTITATNVSGSDTGTVSIEVKAPVPPLALPALENTANQIYTKDLAITTLSFSNSGGDALASCTADTLPVGLAVATSTDSSTCEITGIPTTVQSATTHTITATNATGSALATVSIVIEEPVGNQTSKVVGQIKGMTGGKILDVTVSVYKDGNVQATQAKTNAEGEFDLDLPADSNLTLIFVADGYAKQVQRIKSAVANRQINVDITLLKRGSPKNVAKLGGVITGEQGAKVTIPANAFVDQQGNELGATDGVEVTITPIDISKSIGVALFPGDFSGVVEGQSTASPIISFGTVEYNFTRISDGTSVQLRDGEKAQIEIPIYATKYTNGSLITLGDSIPLWSLDENTGIWNQEGSGMVVVSTESPTGFALKGEVGHFTWWNCDITFPSTLAKVTIFANDSGSATLFARRTVSQFGAWVPESADMFTQVGVENHVVIPAGAEFCLWANINFFNGNSATTPEVCVTAEPNIPININLEVATGVLDTSAFPSNIVSQIGVPLQIKIQPNTAEIGVTYEITSGSLPSGLIFEPFNKVGAIIRGVATEFGSFNAVIMGTDVDGNTDSISLNVNILNSGSNIQPVKKTGESRSFNSSGFHVLDGSIKDDGFYQKGTTHSYIRDDNKQIVIDTVTGLEWQDDGAGQTNNTQENAIAYCSNLNIGGKNDWHLPSIKELQSIIKSGNNIYVSPSIFATGPIDNTFKNSASQLYWTSTSYSNDPLQAFAVSFLAGRTYHFPKTRDSIIYVRCVRGVGKVISGSFSKVNNTVTDSNFGLQWKDDTSIRNKTWKEAIDYCEALLFNNLSDWTVPNINELSTILDYSQSFSAINSVFTQTNNLGSIWSSSHIRTGKAYAKSLDSGSGQIDALLKTDRASVICVRSDY